jgi:hypothetical protein
MKKRSCLFLISILSVLILASSCRTSGGTSKPAAIVDSWQDNFHSWPDKGNIPVCWVNPEEGAPEYLEETEELVKKEYGRAGIAFTGWEPCGASQDWNGIKITLLPDKTSKNISSIGTNDPKPMMILSHGFKDPAVLRDFTAFDPRTGSHPKACQSQRGINCIRSFALHEFGHAAGLRHERERVEDKCDLGGTIVSHEEHWKTATQIGDYDADSIMNYCKIDINMVDDVPATLSDRDIAALKALYDMPLAKISGELVLTADAFYRFDIRILGGRAQVYRYKYGLFETTDCKNTSGYSEPISVQTGITDVLEKSWFGKSVKLCVLGSDGKSWQEPEVYSSTSYKLQ